MNWSAIGAIGELVGGVAVIVSLIYLAIQIRQNTKATRAEIYQQRSQGAADFFMSQATDVEMSELMNSVFEEGLGKLEKLTPLELRLFRSFQLASLPRMDNNHYQYEQGFLEPEYYEEVLVPVIAMNAPFWVKLDLGIRPAFRREIDRILEESPES